MFSKKNIIAAAFQLFDDNVLNEEVLAYFSEITRKTPQFFHQEYDPIEQQIQEMSTAQFKSEFRFGFSELPLMAEALQLPDTFVCCNGSVASGYEGLLLLLKRLTYPCRLSDLIPRFGRSVPEMSLILAEVIDHISNEKGHLLRSLDQPWLQPQNLEKFAEAVHSKGAALTNCWGFIDGTVRPICRPAEHQRVMYNGHKRVHAIKFQSLVAPNGLIANLFGPVGKI